MTAPAITVGGKDTMGLAAGRMAKHNLKRLPVVNEEGELVGVLSRLDILRLIATAKQPKLPVQTTAGLVRTVQDVMRAEIPSVRAYDDLQTVVDALCEYDSQKLVVVDEAGRPVGLISDSDVVSRIQPSEQRGVLKALRRKATSPRIKVRADELMSPGVITAAPDLPVVEAARQMLAEGRKWIVVVDACGQAVGLVDREILLQSITAYYQSSTSL
jgi:CBS-domain-containing membrane protein